MNKFKSLLVGLLSVTAITVTLSSCTPGGGNDDGVTSVALLVNGNLGDKSFFDSANDGLGLIKAKYGDEVAVKAIEMGNDSTKYRNYVYDACEDYDLIVMGTWQMYNLMGEACVKYPNKKFILFDYAGDFSNGKGKDNLYSMEFKQNEAAFLGGAVAAHVTLDNSLPLSAGNKKVGFVGGADSPIIKDFLVGYIEGVHYADPNYNPQVTSNPDKILVYSDFINTFFDPTRAVESANLLYNKGADIVFAAASQAGLGALDSAAEKNKYYMGCDSDQSILFADTPAKVSKIACSVLKKVDVALLRAFDKYLEGTLTFGKNERLGFDEDCIGVSELHDDLSSEVKQSILEIEQKLRSKEILVTTAIGTEGTIVDGIISAAGK